MANQGSTRDQFEEKKTVVKSPSYSELRKEGLFVDAILKDKDGTEWRIHKVIFSQLGILVFNALKYDAPDFNGTLYLDVPQETSQCIIDFAYKGVCDINAENVLEIFNTALMYQLSALVKLCEEFIMEDMKPEDALTVRKFAHSHDCSEDFRIQVDKFIVRNFFQVCQDEKISELNVGELKTIIKLASTQYISQSELLEVIVGIMNKRVDNGKEGEVAHPIGTPIYSLVKIMMMEQLLELEEKIFFGSLGSLKVKERTKWQEALQSRGYDMCCEGLTWGGSDETYTMESREIQPNTADSGKKRDSTGSNKSEVDTDKRSITIKQMSCAILQVGQMVDKKYFKEPLGLKDGEDEEGRVKRLREEKKNRVKRLREEMEREANEDDEEEKDEGSRGKKIRDVDDDIEMQFNVATLEDLVKSMVDHNDKSSWPFDRPITKKEAPVYHLCVAQPMDLGTIRSKMNNIQCTCNQEVLDDIKLCFKNCFSYNEEDSDEYKCGVRLEKYFEKEVRKMGLAEEDDEEVEEVHIEYNNYLKWERSLMSCTNLGQLFMHLTTLDSSIDWSKSIMSTKCRICFRKTVPDNMLVCEGCDRGYHLYCLRPKLENVPIGYWFCPECNHTESDDEIEYEEGEEEETEDDGEEEQEEEEETEDDDEDYEGEELPTYD